ncbi:MAG: GNAT family N-acetyltransferase [Clostridia bacterium]|jgi:GNAT superfamily N-acetyltransferase|nr:GNAT family N-acetyltransferase [Clostridia bacterium]MBT7122821.1 GNAT family N-acetyltransferase [Clostridia bacterium]
MELRRYEPPLGKDLIDELSAFWEATYGFCYDGFRHIFEGDETEHNTDIVYVAREGNDLVGTCHLTIPRGNPELGGLGEVATSVPHRGRGVAGWLCKQALCDFEARGGRALFLGTGNPAAARIYERLGWQRMGNSVVFVNLLHFDTIDDFYADHSAKADGVTIVRGSAAQRIALVPLILYPHETAVLDFNTQICSTKFKIQEMCLGLYPKYAKYESDGQSAWFCAVSQKGRLVGLSTVVCAESQCCVDGFTYPNHKQTEPELLREAIKWAQSRGDVQARVAAQDTEKLAVFESLGFVEKERYAGADMGEMVLLEIEQ